MCIKNNISKRITFPITTHTQNNNTQFIIKTETTHINKVTHHIQYSTEVVVGIYRRYRTMYFLLLLIH